MSQVIVRLLLMLFVLTGASFALSPPESVLKGGIAISGQVKLVPDNKKVSLHLRDVDLRDVLNMLAAQGHLNMILDDSVQGTITVDLDQVSLNKAFEYLFKLESLSYSLDGHTVIVASNNVTDAKNLNVQTFKTIPVHYKDAGIIATQLNKTLFSVPRPGGSKNAIASSEPDSNSLILMGTSADVQLANQALKTLDVPSNRKVYTIRYSSPSFVAQQLANVLFSSGGSGSGSAAPAAAAAPAAGGAAATAAPAAGGAATGGSSVSKAGGVTFISEPVSGTLTVLGSAQQLGLIDSVIDQIDVRKAQVSIEVSLVEMQKSDIKSLVPSIGNFSAGQVNFGFLSGGINNTAVTANATAAPAATFPSNVYNNINNNIYNGFGTSALSGNALGWGKANSNKGLPRLSSFSLQNNLNRSKGRILANPNVVALDGSTSTFDITDELPSIQRTVTVTNGISQTTFTITKESAGINLSVTPKITNDGSVTLALTPKISQPIQQISSPDGSTSTYLISSRSINLGQVRVKDGQTLVIGGLLRESQTMSMSETPFLANLPIVGAMFRTLPNNSKNHTELILMVTPHIIREEATPFPSTSPLPQSASILK